MAGFCHSNAANGRHFLEEHRNNCRSNKIHISKSFHLVPLYRLPFYRFQQALDRTFTPLTARRPPLSNRSLYPVGSVPAGFTGKPK